MPSVAGPRLQTSAQAENRKLPQASGARIKTVYNYETVRWLEKHHKQRLVSRQKLDEERLQQLREMFDHLDEDNSGTIELAELELAMKFLHPDDGSSDTSRKKQSTEAILEQFRYMDVDGSESIDFGEFVSVMTSDIVDQEFFQLNDEVEAAKWDLAFFLFATNFRRQKLIDDIGGADPSLIGVSTTQSDQARYAKFYTLFQVPVLPSSLQDDQALRRYEQEAMRKRHARVLEIRRAQDARNALLNAPTKAHDETTASTSQALILSETQCSRHDRNQEQLICSRNHKGRARLHPSLQPSTGRSDLAIKQHALREARRIWSHGRPQPSSSGHCVGVSARSVKQNPHPPPNKRSERNRFRASSRSIHAAPSS